MEREFQEVFPGVQVESGLAELLQSVVVQRVSLSRKKDLLRVYLQSRQWIHKRYIYQLEDLLKQQLFANVPMQVKIIERFQLSAQYTPENLLEVYRSSIQMELKRHSVFLFNLFYTAKISFPEPDTMKLELVDSVIAREKEEELVRILEKIFCERCGLDLKICPELVDRGEESRAMKNSERKVEEEVKNVLAHTKIGKRLMQGEEMQEEGAEEERAAKEQEKKPASEGKAASGKSADRSGQKVSRGNGKREFHGNKRSSGGFRR